MAVRRYAYASLMEFATKLGEASGLAPDRARIQAEVFIEADLMGHSTHGLNLLPNVLKELEGKQLQTSGEPDVVADRGATLLWDGNMLPGTWLVRRAIDEAISRLPRHPVMTIVIKRSGHIGALAAYLRQPAEAGLVVMLMTTNPMMRTVVPAGGMQPQLAPNPIAFGYPTDGDPILVDISTSAVANGMVRRWTNEKKKMTGQYLLDAEGHPTDEPGVLFGSPPGASLPLGGLEFGHKGFGLGLMVEVLTGGLSGVGHLTKPAEAGNLTYLQITDPAAFAGSDTLKADTGALAKSVRASKPRPGVKSVRMPGDGALAARRRQLAEGVELYPAIMPELEKWAAKLGVPVPAPLA